MDKLGNRFPPLTAAELAARPELPVDVGWVPIVPVPQGVKLPLSLVYRMCPPGHSFCAMWPYTTPGGGISSVIARYNSAVGGKKEFKPFTYCQDAAGRGEWRCQAPPEPRPLYNLDQFAAHDAPILVCEGEKTADAATRIFQDYVATTNPGGAEASGKADWSPLAGRDVTIWPDHDEPGAKYANCVAALAHKAGARTVRIVAVPDGFPHKWDLANPAPEGADVHVLLDGAKEPAHALTGLDKAPGREARGAKTLLLNAEALEMEPIEWLWLHWLAKGKLHLIAGAPEAGKTTIALSLAAAISSGDYWPDGTRAPAGNVLIWTSEDGLADTVKPRLVRMGADLSRIKFVYAQRQADGKERPFNPATDMPSLTDAALSVLGGISLLIIDPVVAVIGTKTNSHNNAETRNSLQPVVDFAESAGCAVIGISHFTKGTPGKDPVERITGSLAFGALPRIVMATAKSTVDVPPRILVRAKSNIGPSGGGFGYDIDAAPVLERPDIIATRVVWLDPIEGTARELLGEAEGEDGKPATKIEQAKRFLETTLANGERPQKEIVDEAALEGIAEKTLRRAKTDICVQTFRKVKGSGPWLWRLN